MKNEIFDALNEEQTRALLQIDGAVLVTAGAGSGKTRLLTHRIVHLMENLSVDPYNILAITFTNKAAGEMKERISRMTPAGEDVWISTFHSMCVRILRQHIGALDARFNKNFSIYSDTESDKVVKALLKEEGLDEKDFKKKILFHLSNMKNNNISLPNYKQQLLYETHGTTIAKIMSAYQNTLVENNALDFDDLLVKTYELFVACPEILDKYAQRFRYILVDEFQDTNTLQYDLVKMLAKVHGNVFAVGDEDQCIYTWRGANFANISNFKTDFPDVKVFKLERNYRSTKTILDAANKLIKNNRQRIDKTLWCDAEKGEAVEVKEVYDEQTEADYVASKIHSLVKFHGYKYSDFAILLRLNALSRPFEHAFNSLSYQIPYVIYGGLKFFERAEIKDIIAYLNLFCNPKDNQAFLRIINFPRRGIGERAIEKIQELAIVHNISCLEVVLRGKELNLDLLIQKKLVGFIETFQSLQQWQYLPLDINNENKENVTLEKFVNAVIMSFGITLQYPKDNDEDTNKRANIGQFVTDVKNSEAKLTSAYLFDKLSEYLHKITLLSGADTKSDDGNVVMASVHAVKGLEFRVVFLPALEEGIFPISRALGKDDEMEEERRLMYVGITRAKEKLVMSNAKTRDMYGRRNHTLRSRFLEDAGFKSAAPKPSFADFGSGFGGMSGGTSFGKNFAFKSQVDSIKTAASAPQPSSMGELKFKIGQKVLHTRFGEGVIKAIDVEERTGDIDFGGIGTKTLMLDIAPLEVMEE